VAVGAPPVPPADVAVGAPPQPPARVAVAAPPVPEPSSASASPQPVRAPVPPLTIDLGDAAHAALDLIDLCL
ncbi:MAG: hypothetical protein HKN41_03445, partial [Ilumatobacter sp.]|nr:hypothetical protein [Ilumatobacter sp.]